MHVLSDEPVKDPSTAMGATVAHEAILKLQSQRRSTLGETISPALQIVDHG
jgi:hypothetical protein